MASFYNVGSGLSSSSHPPPEELLKEVKLYNNARERETVDNRADLFALIQTIQALEKAYIKDAVSSQDYTRECTRLLSQYASAFRLVNDDKFKTVEDFMKRYMMDCPAALQRIKDGKPITIKDDKGNISRTIAEAVSLFITVIDRLKLESRAVDELYPDVKELNETLSRMSTLPQSHGSKEKVKHWLDVLISMKASDELSDDEVRQMTFDLDTAYADFQRFLEH
jgi:ESCRT-I complex subunit VPS28